MIRWGRPQKNIYLVHKSSLLRLTYPAKTHVPPIQLAPIHKSYLFILGQQAEKKGRLNLTTLGPTSCVLKYIYITSLNDSAPLDFLKYKQKEPLIKLQEVAKLVDAACDYKDPLGGISIYKKSSIFIQVSELETKKSFSEE